MARDGNLASQRALQKAGLRPIGSGSDARGPFSTFSTDDPATPVEHIDRS